MQKLADLVSFPEPTWHQCRCGAESMRVGSCFDCEAREIAATEASERVYAALQALPEGFADAAFGPGIVGRVKPPERIADAERFAIAAAARVVLVGAPGTGKTTLGVAMLRRWMDLRKRPAVFCEAFALSGGAMKLDDGLARAPLLLIDDLGAERNMASTLVPELIYQRHAHARPTWITTGFTPEQVQERYGGGISRRVFERAAVVKLG